MQPPRFLLENGAAVIFSLFFEGEIRGKSAVNGYRSEKTPTGYAWLD